MARRIPWSWFWGLLLSAALVYAVRRLPWSAVLATLRAVPWPTWLGLAGLNAFILWLFVLRWGWFLRQMGYHIPWTRLVAYRLAAFGISYFTPGTQFGGEPVQVYALVRRDGVPWAHATASVVLDKLFEVVGNLTVLVLGVAWLQARGLGLAVQKGLWTAVLGGLGAAWVALLLLCSGRWRRAPAWLWAPGRRALARFAAAARAGCPSRKAVFAAVGLTALTWAVLVLEYRWMVRAVGLPGTWLDVVSLLMAARVAFLAPVPGGLGALEAGQYWAAQALGYAPARGLSLAALIRLRDVSVGLVGLALVRHVGGRPWTTELPSRVDVAPSS